MCYVTPNILNLIDGEYLTDNCHHRLTDINRIDQQLKFIHPCTTIEQLL